MEALLADGAGLRRLALGLTGNDSDAQDLAQDACVRVLGGRPDPDLNPKAWFKRIVRNLAFNRRRDQIRLQRRHEAAQIESDTVGYNCIESTETLHALAETYERITVLVRQLRPPLRDVVVLRYYADLTSREIAQRLTIPEGTVRWRLKTAIEQLGQRLAESDSERPWMRALAPVVSGVSRRSSRLSPLMAGAVVLTVVATAFIVWGNRSPGKVLAGHAMPADRRDAPVPNHAQSLAAQPPTNAVPRLPAEVVAVEPAEPSSTQIIAGRVLDASEGSVVGAVVTALGLGNRTDREISTTTDSSGSFTLKVPPDAYRVIATAPGYGTGEVEIYFGARGKMTFRMQPEAVLTGTVLIGNVGMARASVTLLDSEQHRVRVVNTDARGRFSMAALNPGDYTVVAHRGPLATEVPVSLRATDLIDLRVLMQSRARITGLLRDGLGHPVRNAEITVHRRDWRAGVHWHATANDSGYFTLSGVLPGAYILQAEAPFATGLAPKQTRGVVEARDVDLATITLESGGRIQGQALTVDGRPAVGALVTAWTTAPDRIEVFNRRYTSTRVDGDGIFHFDALASGTVRVHLHNLDGTSAKVDVGLAPREAQSIVLRSRRTATVAGIVHWSDGQPASGVHVVAGWKHKGTDGQDGWAVDTTTTDDGGQFEFTELPTDGVVDVVASRRAFGVVMCHGLPHCERTEMGPTIPIASLILPVQASIISGIVLDTAGAPISGMSVRAEPMIDGNRWIMGGDGIERDISNERGEFTLERLEPGPHVLVASHPDHATTRIENVYPETKGVVIVAQIGSTTVKTLGPNRAVNP